MQDFSDRKPTVHETAFIASGAVVLGDVTLEEDSSVWFNAVARGDQDRIIVGRGSNIQDLSMLHVSEGNRCIIGQMVTVGHRVVIHGASIGDKSVVGIGSIILDGAVVGAESVIAAGSVVTPGKVFPPRAFLIGTPARHTRDISDEELMINQAITLRYIERAKTYMKMQD